MYSVVLVLPITGPTEPWARISKRLRSPEIRVSSKQTKINFGSNQNKPKQDLFRVCFGLFRKTKNKLFLFVSVFQTYIETTETNRIVSKQTEKNRKKPKKKKKKRKKTEKP